MRFDRDVPVTMRDGARLLTNVFRPEPDGRYPVLLSVTPYGKDVLPDRIQMLLMRLSGVRFGKLDCSNWTGFEAPDPLFWTTAGYTVEQLPRESVAVEARQQTARFTQCRGPQQFRL